MPGDARADDASADYDDFCSFHDCWSLGTASIVICATVQSE
jgi:hypothetical protein